MYNAVFLGMMIPLIFLIIMLRFEHRLLMLFFTWGLIAFLLSLQVNTWITSIFSLTYEQLSTTWAPIVEECFKALPMLYFLFLRKDKKRSESYSLLYFAMASGIGFSIQENYLYLFHSIDTQNSLVIYMILRSITTCLMHGMTTAIVGYGISLIQNTIIMKGPLLFGLLSLAVTIHSLFNLYINSQYFFVRTLAMVIPFALYIVGLLLIEKKQDDEEHVI